MKNKSKLTLAIDINETIATHRVGSNVYAFELITEIYQQLKHRKDVVVHLLSSEKAPSDLPPEKSNWKYHQFGPKFMWTQWALPKYLYQHRDEIDLFFTPGHYAPRFCPMPYISSVMDTAYLDFPEQFKFLDQLKLRNWTKYSVNNAAKVLTISQATKKSIVKNYFIDPKKVVVAYPGIEAENKKISKKTQKKVLNKYQIDQPYILFVGTIQPRKNIIRLVEAFEMFSRMYWSRTNSKQDSPKLVLAGKTGWLTRSIVDRIKASPNSDDIILTGFVTDTDKAVLYKNAFCSVLIGLKEGFGIPPLESMVFGTVPVVANSSSLPEVVGDAGFLVDPYQPHEVAESFWQAINLSSSKLANYRKKMKTQLSKFSWKLSAKEVLAAIEEVAQDV